MGHKLELEPELWLPSEFPYEFSTLSTENEEDKFLAELTYKSKLLQLQFELTQQNCVQSGSPHLWNRSTRSINPNAHSQAYGFNNCHFHQVVGEQHNCDMFKYRMQIEKQNQYHHHQPSCTKSIIRTSFIGKKNECAGTGVFLPRRYGSTNPIGSRNKSGCSTATHPSTMVQPLHPPLRCQPQPGFNGGTITDFDILMARTALLAQQKRYLCQGLRSIES